MTETYALIAAAGRGVRFNTDGNKVYANLIDRPILRWTVEAFASCEFIDGIVVVTGADDVQYCKSILAGIDRILAIVPGGTTRQESVFIGISTLAGNHENLVFVHDGARPFVDRDIIKRCYDAALTHGSAVAAVPVNDTLKKADDNGVIINTVDRSGMWAMQTPQVFQWGTLAKAHVLARDESFTGTDEASVVERSGVPVHLVLGSTENLKITTQQDMRLAEIIMSTRLQNNTLTIKNESAKHIVVSPGKDMVGINQDTNKKITRVGYGYDAHRFAEGRRLFLGGVEFPQVDGKGLDGHSDADVALHALCDALLGAAGQPDIGHLFPNSDPAYRGISSITLLEQVRDRLVQVGAEIGNVDIVIVAEQPKISPKIDIMRNLISSALQIEPQFIGIKATTNEGLDAVGECKGIIAHAVATVSK